jgi:hypothetical protein
MNTPKFYYSMYSDDNIVWRPLQIGWYLSTVVEHSRDCPYSIRYYDCDHNIISYDDVCEAECEYETFQTIVIPHG